MNFSQDSESADGTVEALLERARDGDERAFAELFGLFLPQLTRFIASRLDGNLLRRVDASDVLQETQLQVHRRLGDYLRRRPMPFRVWLHKTAYQQLSILRRHAESAKRAMHRDVSLPERSSLLLARRLLSSGLTASKEARKRELAERVQAALAKLEDRDREILVMRNVDGLSFEDASHILGIESAAARKRHARALMRLHKALTDSGLTESQI